jgi:hypothetical protein
MSSNDICLLMFLNLRIISWDLFSLFTSIQQVYSSTATNMGRHARIIMAVNTKMLQALASLLRALGCLCIAPALAWTVFVQVEIPWHIYISFFFGTRAQLELGNPHSWGFYITHNYTTQPVGLLWTRDRPVAETSTWQHTTLKGDTYPCHRRDLNSQPQQAIGRRPSP